MKGKIIGYILLVFSILIIVGATVNVYFVFTGRLSPVNVFKPLTISSLLPVPQEDDVLESQNGGNNDLSVGLNIFAHLALMGFVSSAAFKIGRLGVMMIRPIKVRLNQEK